MNSMMYSELWFKILMMFFREGSNFQVSNALYMPYFLKKNKESFGCSLYTVTSIWLVLNPCYGCSVTALFKGTGHNKFVQRGPTLSGEVGKGGLSKTPPIS